MSNSAKMKLWKDWHGQVLSFRYQRSGAFPDHVIKPSRKGFNLGTWD